MPLLPRTWVKFRVFGFNIMLSYILIVSIFVWSESGSNTYSVEMGCNSLKCLYLILYIPSLVLAHLRESNDVSPLNGFELLTCDHAFRDWDEYMCVHWPEARLKWTKSLTKWIKEPRSLFSKWCHSREGMERKNWAMFSSCFQDWFTHYLIEIKAIPT